MMAAVASGQTDKWKNRVMNEAKMRGLKQVELVLPTFLNHRKQKNKKT